jgi:hypothetical protein
MCGQVHEMEGSIMINAIIAAVVSLVVAVLSAIVTLRIADRNHKRQFKLAYQVEDLVLKFLNHPKWRFRTFKTIKHHIAGFEDDELRKILVSVGALKFTDAEDIEVWGLYERVQPELGSEVNTRDN